MCCRGVGEGNPVLFSRAGQLLVWGGRSRSANWSLSKIVYGEIGVFCLGVDVGSSHTHVLSMGNTLVS